ncbi:MAG: hypothetical protein P8P74_01520 [Crocinitomicaceae bacterium]|nr:hypothetical protein [Crocinitomicaceae bacterium]
MKGKMRLTLALSAILLITGCVNVFKVVDLRPNEENPLSNQEKAKQLLEEMGTAHGISNWDSIQTYKVTFHDEFYGFIGKQAHPFKEQEMTFSLHYIPKTSNGQLEIASGKQKGTVWGIQDWTTYYKNESGVMTSKKNKDMTFWIPTYQYFIELPNRIQEATSIDYIGQKLMDSVQVEGVIASWGTTEPQKDVDQYIIWINSETKRIVKVEYTVRDMYRFVSGAASFQEYKEYNGILLPSKMPVESNLTKDLLHTMSISDFMPNSVPVDSLMPLK